MEWAVSPAGCHTGAGGDIHTEQVVRTGCSTSFPFHTVVIDKRRKIDGERF